MSIFSCRPEDQIDRCESFGTSPTENQVMTTITPERKQLVRSLAQGTVDHDSIEQLVASRRSQDTRARLILSQIDFEGNPPKAVKSSKNLDIQMDSHVPNPNGAIQLSAKDRAAPPFGDSEPTLSLESSGRTKHARSDRHQDLSRLQFRSRSGKTILRLYGNKSLTVRMVSVVSGKRLRLVVEGQSASDKVLRSRAQGRGVQVSHVKMGDRSILIVLELDDGWYAQVPRSRRNGAEIVFARG